MPIYGGDEVNALVIDVGSGWTRAGFAGEDIPKAFFPSLVAYLDEQTANGTADSTQKDPGDNDAMEVEAKTSDQGGQDGGPRAESEGLDSRIKSKSGDAGDSKREPRRKYFIGNGISTKYRPGMDVKGPLKDGLIDDWNIYENIWTYAFEDYLHAKPEEHPIFASESLWNTPALRERLTEMAFEKFNVPAFFVCNTAVLSTFAAGKHTALVVESGAEITSVVPVFEGFALKKGAVRQEGSFGGNFISDQILAQLERDYRYKPRGLFEIESKVPVEAMQQPNVKLRANVLPELVTDSFQLMTRRNIVHEYKEAVCSVSAVQFSPDNPGELANQPQKPFEFPDGFNISVGVERFKAPEIMFQPKQFVITPVSGAESLAAKSSAPESAADSKAPETSDAGGAKSNDENKDKGEGGSAAPRLMGIHEMAMASVLRCDIDLRPHLLSNVVVSGGNTAFQMFSERLAGQLMVAAPGSKVRLFSATTLPERSFMPWLGGSILASLGTFHQMWISRQEYDEQGASIVGKKCQ